MAYAIELDAPNADDKAFGHDTPFERAIKIRDGALARPLSCPDVRSRLGRLMCGKALPFRES